MLNSKEWEEMFTRKEWRFEFLWIDFKFLLIVDIRDGEDELYDISTRGVSSFTPDFLKEDGQFDNRQYCICLIKTVFELSFTDFPKFLKYQSTFMESPIDWLYDFHELLRINENFSLLKPFMKRFELMREIISEECISISTKERNQNTDRSLDLVKEPEGVYHIVKVLDEMDETSDYKVHISCCKKARATYFRKVENANESSFFVRVVDRFIDAREEVVSKTPDRVVWDGTAKALAKHHISENVPRDNRGKFIVPPCHATEARRIGDLYTDSEGNPFKFETLQKEIGRVVREIKSMYDSEDEK